MGLRLFNTLSKKKGAFTPLKKNEVGLYTCGPTVYHYAHIGNLRSYLFEDILKRTLLHNGFKVKHVMNITDVGHLTSDADEGEDKMLKGARREKKTVWQIADFYTKAFQQDLQKLHVIPPAVWCKATEHIAEQIKLIQQLEKQGFTYTAGGNVYFATSKLADYGKLAKLKLTAETKARVQKDKNKKNQYDFVLWFTKSKFQEQEMKWDSPWGVGYPGWHIECSAMASKYLGKQFDIHCGGIDHIPVHHTNEIAQSEAAFGKKPWVKYWLHNEFLVLPGDARMAKSGGNFITLSAVEEKGFAPLDYRYLCLGTHYRKPLMFSWEALEGARNARKKLFEKVLELKEAHGRDHKRAQQKYLAAFTAALDDDLNTPRALAVLWDVIKDDALSNHDKYYLLLQFDKVLGFNFGEITEEKIPPDVLRLADERLQARNARDWQKADDLRKKINQLGYDVGDTKEGYEVRRKTFSTKPQQK